ncbi:venom allergen 5 [Tribolium castaneum]|uniref:CRISP/Allergen/PR-1-like Protein n=1 Tax=Tribolium castaneum TaxID=7070 RepID=D6W9E3_TRICA|nr:PREDICTED: venom allergen 5 [Tribolium castaneum]EEZ98173.1 CRISP/Allergen/PR-1-like Protein [Tribolium castaneum]|eukprot:XP_970839.1 PREDICTED: venom allergen 5 [Tribolium castaneum]
MLPFALIGFVVFFATGGSADECGEIMVKGLTDEEKQLVVNIHNEIRSWIVQGQVPNQPKGKNLYVMGWDDALASEAQKISETCVMKHVRVKDERFYVGQNLAMLNSTAPDNDTFLERFVMMWFDEYPKFDYPNLAKGTGHYSQVIWDKSQYIGCGYTYFHKNRKGDKYPYKKLFVCNYGPGGNMQETPPYEKAQ